MKIIVLGDIHGRYDWKQIVLNNTFDLIVFIGDYLDTHDPNNSGSQQLNNLADILEYKKQNKDKVVLLFGNHDFHYLSTSKHKYSGFQAVFKFNFQELLHKAIDQNLIQMCFKYKDILFTHAGITKTWCKNNNINLENIEQSINDLFKYKPNSFEFTPGDRFDMYGDDIEQTPIWVRPYSLRKDKLDNFRQVVGHTTQDNLIIKDITIIDTLGTSGEFLIIENGKMLTGKNENL